jgi:hypothetical protein
MKKSSIILVLLLVIASVSAQYNDVADVTAGNVDFLDQPASDPEYFDLMGRMILNVDTLYVEFRKSKLERWNILSYGIKDMEFKAVDTENYIANLDLVQGSDEDPADATWMRHNNYVTLIIRYKNMNFYFKEKFE